MVDLRLELDLGRLERVVLRELDLQKEHTAFVWALRGTHDGRLRVAKASVGGETNTSWVPSIVPAI